MAGGGRNSERATLEHAGANPSDVVELFDHVEDVLFWMKDGQGHYRWVNLPFVLNFGFKSRIELLGRTDFDICSLALANQYRLDDERVLGGERIVGRIELVGRFDHTARWCTTSKVPLEDYKRRVVGTAGTTRPLTGRRPVADSPLSKAIHYISEHYAESITNQHLASVSGLSVRALERQFSTAYASSPHDYIRQLRVRMSCHALVYSRKTLAQVASEFGFADQSHFTKEFRRLQGQTPHAYRARFK
jgi:AraC-like DNA-binding protein